MCVAETEVSSAVNRFTALNMAAVGFTSAEKSSSISVYTIGTMELGVILVSEDETLGPGETSGDMLGLIARS